MLQRWDEVASRLAIFLARNPGNLPMRFAFAGVLLRAGRKVQAQREYYTLSVLDPAFDGMNDLAKQLGEPETRSVPNHAA